VNLRRWDIVYVQAEDKTINVDHPCVVLVARGPPREPEGTADQCPDGNEETTRGRIWANHVLLDEADGLDFPTLVDCSFVLVARKTAITRVAGKVTVFRRQEIQRKIRAFLGLG